MQRLEYRKAVQSDIPYLLWLRMETMEYHLTNSGISLNQDEHLQRVKHHFNQTKIVLHNGEVIGLIKLDIKEQEVEIVQVQIDPKFQSRGFGYQIIKSVIENPKNKHKKITLSVLKQNPAKDLYFRLGFKIISEDNTSYHMTRDTQPSI